jgi:hypothetical protein
MDIKTMEDFVPLTGLSMDEVRRGYDEVMNWLIAFDAWKRSKAEPPREPTKH